MSDSAQDTNPLLLQRATLNPYLSAISILYDRLIWDLSTTSWI